MKQITHESISAFLQRHVMHKQNMSIKRGNGFAYEMRLHGNLIAIIEQDNSIRVSFAGWPTPTTKERLNGLAELATGERPFYTKKGQLYFNDTPIDSNDWYTLRNPL